LKYCLDIDDDNKIVKATATGLLNLVKRKEMLRSIQQILTSTGFLNVIIDLQETRLDPDEPVSGAFELIAYMKEIGFSPDVKLAFIALVNEYHRDYFEEFAKRGGFSIRYFQTSEDALVWLG